MNTTCFHCGLPLPNKIEHHVLIDGRNRPMCCAGCSAVAQTIVASGLTDYYSGRDAMASPAEAVPKFLDELSAYDLPELQKTFVYQDANDVLEAAFLLEGVRCGACVWLIERRLRQLPGVLTVEINYATRRMRVQWKNSNIKLSKILAAVASIGYHASPYDPNKAETARRTKQRESIKRLAIAALCMMQVMMFAIPAYLAGDSEISADQDHLMRWASLVLTIPALIYSAQEFFIGAWRDLTNRHLGMNTPITLGIAIAFIVSAWNTIAAHGDVYFDSITMFVFLLLAVRFLEQLVHFRADDLLDRLARILPEYCHRFDNYPTSRATRLTASSTLSKDDYLLIGSGEPIPADGVVIEGAGDNDESLLTGESRPIPKAPHSMVMAGAVNVGNPLVIRVIATGAQNTIGKVARLIDRALSEKPSIARLADKAASWFVLGLLIVTLLVAAYWGVSAPDRWLPIVVALLVITCPCALSLATPAVLTAATYRLARNGLLPTRGHAIETLAQVTDIVFDKTGTLTAGKPSLIRITLLGEQNQAEALATAAALESGSTHPVAKTLRAASHEPKAATNLITRPGSGVEGTIDGRAYRIGSVEFVRGLTRTALPAESQAPDPATIVGLGSKDGWLALFHFVDLLRPESRAVIRQLQSMGKTVHLLSGDTPGIVAKTAIQAGIAHGRGNATPMRKLAYIQALQAQGAVVAMIGDGVNDAPSLGGAQVSIAMGSGTDLAQTAADMILLSENLNIFPEALNTARMARRVMRQNLAWAVAYNLIAIPLAASGFVTPLTAAIGMSVSSIIVVLNALRLAPSRRVPKTHDEAAGQTVGATAA